MLPVCSSAQAAKCLQLTAFLPKLDSSTDSFQVLIIPVLLSALLSYRSIAGILTLPSLQILSLADAIAP